MTVRGWQISKEIRITELITIGMLVLTILGLVRKTELRMIGLETATRSNTDSITRLAKAVDDLTGQEGDTKLWIKGHDSKEEAMKR